MLKLYEYTDQYLQLMNDLQDTDLPDDVIADTIEGLKGEIKLKGKDLGSFILNMDANVAMLKELEAKTKNKRLAMEKRNAWLKSYMLTNMQATEITEISCDYFTIKPCKNPPAVWFTNEDLIPGKYKTKVTTIKINKTAIAKDLKSGVPVMGAELHQGWRLDIK